MSRTATAIRDLHPGYFAFVMATGIISTGTFLLGPSWLSKGLLVVASIGLVVLSTALVVRLAVFRSSVAADIQAPERVFGFFTIVAGIDVLGVRLAGWFAGAAAAVRELSGQQREAVTLPARRWSATVRMPPSGPGLQLDSG